MKTNSEELFEAFLSDQSLRFEKIQEATSPRPDYLVHGGDFQVIFELKELAEDEKFGVVSDPAHPQIKSFSGTLGAHVRRRIDGSRKQVQYGTKQGIPSVLLIYNSLDRVFQTFGTSDLDFTTAMYGELTTLINRKTRQASELFNGKNQLLQQNKNTSFSAVGRLCDRGGKTTVTLFENVFAKLKLPFEQLPPCFEIKRIEISDEPLVIPDHER
jgi:hypothetical protein